MITPIRKLIPLLAGVASLLFSHADADDFETIRNRVIAELMKVKVPDADVEAILEKMSPDGSFPHIDYADLSRTAGFPHSRHTAALVSLATAYKDKKSKYYRSRKVKERIVTSLKYWVEGDFVGDNWHNNQISTPTYLVNLMLLVGGELPEELVEKAQPIIGRAHMNASGARPSGDRIVIAGILAKNQLFIRDRKGFDETIRIIEGEVKFSTGQRGMQHDYSFHHRVDRVNNTTSYGYGKYANVFGEWSYYVANTAYAFSVENINHLVDYYLEGIYKQMVYGIYIDVSVKNRSITQQSDFRPQGVLEIERLLFGTDYRRNELEEIIRLRKGEAKPSKSFAKFFWQTEHFVFQRPNFYTTVRMFSTRNRNMEEPYNGPGKPTHHRADGTNYLMLKGDEYHNIWPVYDWQKISGTTILQKSALPPPDKIQMEGYTDFVGAVTDDLYGAVAFDFISPHDIVKAKKSWFFFDQEYVCLGSNISSRANLPVATTVNQVLMRTDVSVMQEGTTKKLPRGQHELKNLHAVYQDRVGYIFPAASTVMLSNQAQQGRWSDITDQKNISRELVSMDVFSLWFDHGRRPDSATYQYIVVPDVDEETLWKTAADHRGIEILAHTSDVHAVMHNKLRLCQMAFWRAGEVNIEGDLKLRMDSQGMAMVRLNGDRISSLTVSDPSRKLSKIMVTVSGHYDVKGGYFGTLPDADQESTTIVIDLPHGVYAGKSVTINLD